MITGVDVANDYLHWPAREPATLVVVGASGAATQHALSDAKRSRLGWRELAPSAGVYTGQDVSWRVPAVLIPGVTPKVGDRIKDAANVEWTALEVESLKWRTVWRLVCRSFVLAFGLGDTIALHRDTPTAGAAGGRVSSYAAVVTGVPARIQETSADAGTRLGKRQSVKRYTVYVGQRLTVEATDRLIDQHGTVYSILSSQSPDRIDQLQELECERVR